MSKILVAYFSAGGVTKGVAQKIAVAVGADIFEIRPTIPYTKADLDWMDRKSRSTLEMNDEKSRPSIAGTLQNPDDYETIFLGFPVWWYVEPRIIDTFLDSFELSGKIIIPFATSGSSGIENCEKHLRAMYKDASWRDGKLLNSGDAGAWAKSAL